MSKDRAWVWGLLVIAVAAVVWYRAKVFNEPAQPMSTRAVFVTGGSDPYWTLTINGAKAAAKAHNVQLDIVRLNSDEDVAQQTKVLLELQKEEDLDGVAVSPLDAEGQTRCINALADKMHVVTFDSDAPLSLRDGFVGASNYGAGQMSARLTAEALPEGGKVLVLLSNLSKTNMIDRKEGFEEAFEELSSESAPEVVAFLSDEGSQVTCQANIQTTLEQHADLAAIVGMNGYHGPAVVEALKESSQRGSLKLIMFDEADATLAGIESGQIHGTVAQDPYMYGYRAVRWIADLHRDPDHEKSLFGGGVLTVPCEIIRADNLEEFKKTLSKRISEAEAAAQEPAGAAE